MIAYLLLIERYLSIFRRQCAFTNSIPDGSTGILLIDNIILQMSEQIDPATVNSATVIVKDSAGYVVEGDAYVAADQKTIVFVPKYGYQYGQTYTMTLNGVKDLGGNTIAPYTSTFSTFDARVLPNTQDVQVAMAIDHYKNYVVVKGVDPSLGDITRSSTIKIYDVADPEHPQLRGSLNLYGYIHDIKTITDVTIGGITGDFVIAVGGFDIRESYLYTINVTDPAKPAAVGYVYLSWSPNYGEPPANVPYGGGTPYELALIDTYAYVANYGIGLQAVDLTQATPLLETDHARAIIGTLTEPSYMSVSKVKNNVLAVKNGVLSVLSSQLQVLSEFAGLNYPYSVTGVEAFPMDIDNDGNLGTFEDTDGDTTTAAQEKFDLALVSTNEGVVIFNITKPSSPEKIALIPGAGGRLVVDRERGLVYTTSGAVISLKDLGPNDPSALSLKDSNGDGKDDRILGMIQGIGAMDIVTNDSSTMAYLADYSGGKVEVVNLGPEIVVLDDNGLAPEEIKFGDGSKAEKRYKLRLVGMDNSASCSTLRGKIRARNVNGVITKAGANYYQPEYNLYFEPVNGKCIVKIVDNNIPKEKFVVLNMSEAALRERLLELLEVYGVSVDLSKTAILYGGIGNKVEIEIGRIKKVVPIEPVGVIVIGIDGLRQDVLYTSSEASYSDPQGCGGSCNVPINPTTLPGLSKILKDEGTVKLKNVTAIFPSITFASWASVFTGKMPKDTGITGNEFFARDRYSSTDTNTVPGLSEAGVPAGFVSLDGGAFDPGGKTFVLNHAIPSEYIPGLSRERTLAGKITDSAPGDVLLTEPVWLSIKDTLKTKYQTSPDMNTRCDKSTYECGTVSMFNQYALGVDWWGTASARENFADLLGGVANDGLKLALTKIMDQAATNEAVAFIKNYFASTTPSGKRKTFPAVFSIYYSALDHYAHEKGMSDYTVFLMNTTDSEIRDVVTALKQQDEFYNKIFIIVADHGHTAMPIFGKVTLYPGTEDERDVTPDTSCKLTVEKFNKRNVQDSEKANNNLHIWELGELLKFTGSIKGTAGLNFAVMVPTEIAGLYDHFSYGAKPDTATANVIAAFNGPMAHIYVKNRANNSWNSPRRVEDIGYVAELLRLSLSKDKSPSNLGGLFSPGLFEKAIPISAGLKRLITAIDIILIRRGNNYEVFQGIQPDGSDIISTPLNNYADLSSSMYVKAIARIVGLNHPDRSGDIVLIMKDATMGDALDRYTTGAACKSWHGSLNPSDSYVPFVVAYTGGNKVEIEPLINNTQGCTTAQGCDGNWRVTDLIKTIIQKQYGAQ